MMRIEELENACAQTIVIEASETNDTLAKCNSQFQSPLFSTLPREIRDLIWSFATAPVEDETQKYAVNGYYCRPGHRARHKTYTSLLYTCRRVWLEANALPMLQAEHCFWYHRAAPDQRNPEWMANLTELNRRNFGHLHLFAQMFAIEGLRAQKGALRRYFLTTPERQGDFQPRMLHVTIRHTDWWFWESEEPLRFKDSWFKAMLDSPDLRINQLMPIVERLKRLESEEYETHVVHGKPAKTKFVLTGEPEVYTWSGPTNINGENFGPYKGKSTLNYYVVILTWKLRFPEIPRAHIPTLRRAPRTSNPDQNHPSEAPDDLDDDSLGWLPPDDLFDDVSDGQPDNPSDELNLTLTPWDEPLPPRPRSSDFDIQPPYGASSDVRRMVRRVRMMCNLGDTWGLSRKEEDEQHMFGALGRQAHLCALQKWQDNVRRTAERKRFCGDMAILHREKWERRWRDEGSLLRFE